MPVRPVRLNYGLGAEDGFGPTPKEVEVKPGDTIQFRRGPNNPPNTRIRITLKTSESISGEALDKIFSHRSVEHEPGGKGDESLEIEIRGALTGKVSYLCELIDANDNVISVSEGGGEIVPDTGI